MPESTLRGLLDGAAKRGLERIDARLLLQKVTGWTTEQVLAHPEWGPGSDAAANFEGLLARRAAGEPIAYLTGEREFYGRAFKVDRRALIPRPETELLVELGVAAIGRWRGNGLEPSVVDVGTGAGAIAISLSLEAQLPVAATDVSFEALTLARENARAFAADVSFVQADLLNGVRGPFHVVLANLPYVPTHRVLPPDVKDYEPHVALFGGPTGTELIRRFLADVRQWLAPGGEVCLELDEEEQATPVASLARTLYPEAEVSVVQDNGGYDRVVRLSLSLRPAV